MVDYIKVYTKDYIEVSAGEVYVASLWVYNHSVAAALKFYLQFYDSDFNDLSKTIQIGEEDLTTGSWLQTIGYVRIPEGVSYARVFIQGANVGAGTYIFVDSVSLQKVNYSNIGGMHHQLIDVITDLTAHTVTGKSFFSGFFKEGEYVLDVASFTETATGGTLTLDVKIQGRDIDTDNWIDLVSFTQVVCPSGGNANNTIERKTVANFNGWEVRVSYTTAHTGTIGDLDFRVGAILK